MTTWYCKVLYGTRSIHIFPHYSNIYNRSTDILPILILVSHSYNRLKSKIITHESVIITLGHSKIIEQCVLYPHIIHQLKWTIYNTIIYLKA